jgi:hypothetical protein
MPEDEELKLPDSLARRLIFKPLPAEGPLFISSKEPSKIMCLNLTREQFKPGACKFRDLKQDAFDTAALWFNAIAFALDKKRRLSTTPQEKKQSALRANQRQHQQGGGGDYGGNNGGGGGANPHLNEEGIMVQSEQVQQEKEGSFINGAQYITVYIETLMETDGANQASFRVGGYRLWVLDASDDKSGLDLLTKGVKETLVESRLIQASTRSKIEDIMAKTARATKGAYQQKVFGLRPRFNYTNLVTEEQLITHISKYFSVDGLLSKQVAPPPTLHFPAAMVEDELEEIMDEEEDDDFNVDAPTTRKQPVAAAGTTQPIAQNRQFVDSRAFLTHNRARSIVSGGAQEFVPRICERTNTMHSFFGKEQAMVYHVEKDGIRLDQRTLASYFGETSDEIKDGLQHRQQEARNPQRLHAMWDEKVADKQFRQFPYPSTTYQIDEQYLSFDVFAEMPLPHHLGTYLYTSADQDVATKRIQEAQGVIQSTAANKPTAATTTTRDLFGYEARRRNDYSDDDGDEEGNGSSTAIRTKVTPLGLYDTEYEVNTSLMHIYDHYLTEDMKLALANMANNDGGRTSVPRHIRESFLGLIEADIRMGLLNLINQVDKPKPYVAELSGNKEAMAEGLPYLEVEAKEGNGSLLYRATSVACQLHNRDKRHLIDHAVCNVVGGDNNATIKEKNKNLSLGNGAYFRSIIAQWRPVDATVDNALACMGGATYDKVFLERDIYLILDVLNRHGYAQIDKKFFNPKTRKVRRGQMHRYVTTRRAFTEAITVEFYDEFFCSTKVSMANQGIRADLIGMRGNRVDRTKRHIGMRMPQTQFNMQVRPFHAYKMWVYSYFVEHDGINHNYKTSDILFHARYHHCRSYPPHSKDPKMNVLMSGQGTAGKSHKLGATKDACPSGVAEGITHMTNQTFNVDQNMNDMLIINEEMSNKLIAPSSSKSGNGTSEAANDDVRNNFKERSTGGMTASLTFYFDEETGERRARLSKCSCQNVILGATNNDLSDSDPNVMSRFIIISVPKSKNDVIGNRPQDKNKLEIGKDETKQTILQEQVKEVHRIYYMVECMIKSGILGNTLFGVAIDGAQIYMTRILDLLQSKYGIATNDIRKRKHVIEMARCMCISFACWFGLTSPTTAYLQYDVYTGEYIGFNPRVLLDGIVPYLVVTKDMVINAISSLSCLWGHEYMDKILENLATSMCQLQKLREADFLKRPRSEIEGPGSATTATSALTTRIDPNKNKNKGRMTGGFGAAAVTDNNDDMVYDYNYIIVTSKSHADIHNLLSNSLGDLSVAPNDISKVLRDLSRTYIQTAGYEMGHDENGQQRLIKSTDPAHCIPRRIVDYGGSPVNGQPAIAISVAFLKQKLPHLLPDLLIEDLTQYTFGGIEQTEQEREEEDEVMADEVSPQEVAAAAEDSMLMHRQELDEDGDVMMSEMTEKQSKKLVDKLMNAITIKSNSPNESCVIKAIKDVLENSVLEYNPEENPLQEEANFKDYADVHTGQVPWFTYATSEHPQPLLISALFPEMKDQYAKVHGHNKEIILSDKISVIHLQRKKNGLPLVYYNYNTVSPTAQSSLSIFQVDEVQYPVLREGETDANIIEEVQELDAIRAENARFEEVHKNRFRKFADNPVFLIDRDLDYTSCETHLLNIGYPVKRHAGRLVNYPPHIYMNIADVRDKAQNAPPIVPLYADIMERIATTKKIIRANCGIFDKNTPTYHGLVVSNFEREDLRDSAYGGHTSMAVNDGEDGMDVENNPDNSMMLDEPVQHAPVTRRSFVYRAAELDRSKKNSAESNKRYGMGALGEIITSSHYLTNKRPAKKAKKT